MAYLILMAYIFIHDNVRSSIVFAALLPPVLSPPHPICTYNSPYGAEVAGYPGDYRTNEGEDARGDNDQAPRAEGTRADGQAPGAKDAQDNGQDVLVCVRIQKKDSRDSQGDGREGGQL